MFLIGVKPSYSMRMLLSAKLQSKRHFQVGNALFEVTKKYGSRNVSVV